MSRSRFRGAVPLGLFAAFVAGMVLDGWLRTYGPPKPVTVESEEAPAAAISAPRVPPPTAAISSAPPSSAAPASALTSAVAGLNGTSGTSGSLPSKRLRLPIDGEDIESFKGGFAETRGGTRPHEAVDMLAPRNTPVHAVENGTIAKLFTSKAGGLTIYQFDPGGHLCYYYAHLQRYADGVKEGQAVAQGDVIGYVGTSGNAPPNTPHLHFAVFELNADKHWWQGKAIDPYRVFKDRG
jgi:murein DD-endopeptidase MepM/ murein hydrolase activator NlpD